MDAREPSEIHVEGPGGFFTPEGKVYPAWQRPPGLTLRDYLICSALFLATVFTTWLVMGIWFSLSLLLILGAHESGHFWAARNHNVRTSLPYFLPAPPIFLAGTFGAFIRIKEPIPDRRALLEIGAYGPIAGFIVAVPVLAVGLSLSLVTPDTGGASGQISFGSSIAMTVLSKLVLGVTPFTAGVNIELHPCAFAGWFGLFFTALNLWPAGQLDGGHIIYALFPKRNFLVAKYCIALLVIMGYWWPGWWVWAVMVLLIGVRHPPLPDESVFLEKKHRLIGYASIFIFLITILPIPVDVIP